MIERIHFLWPEIALFATTCVVMLVGLSRVLALRSLAAPLTGLGLAVAGVVAIWFSPSPGPKSGQVLLPELMPYAKTVIAAVGLLLLMLSPGVVDRGEEAEIASGRRGFDALRTNRAEYYGFFLFSLTGLMLCASAADLIWLFLALELTSLPTYIMVTMSTGGNRSREAGVKYFFLGALGAATFLYGFALIYGGTGTTNLNQIHNIIAADGAGLVTLAGFMLAIIGVSFKIAAVPMHFYAADVYQGAASPVTAFLAFVPKTAGFITILLLCGALSWGFAPGIPPHDQAMNFTPMSAAEIQSLGEPPRLGLPEPVRVLLWVMAAMTMTIGNVLAIVQHSVKRILAYSSIAHSGYMLVAVIAGPGDNTFVTSGVSAVLFYLLVYGVSNVGAFAVLASLEHAADKTGEHAEADDVEDIKGLFRSRPVHAAVLTLSCLGLMGLPPLLGFFGKVPLFTSGLSAGEYVLVVILGLNSAIAAFYYLRLIKAALIDEPSGTVPADSPFRSRAAAGWLSAAAVVVLAVVSSPLMGHAEHAGRYSSRQVEAIRAKRPSASPRATFSDSGFIGEALQKGTSLPGTQSLPGAKKK